jgi:hypothetical protein
VPGVKLRSRRWIFILASTVLVVDSDPSAAFRLQVPTVLPLYSTAFRLQQQFNNAQPVPRSSLFTPVQLERLCPDQASICGRGVSFVLWRMHDPSESNLDMSGSARSRRGANRNPTGLRAFAAWLSIAVGSGFLLVLAGAAQNGCPRGLRWKVPVIRHNWSASRSIRS